MGSRFICVRLLMMRRGLLVLLVLALFLGVDRTTCQARPKSKVRLNQLQRSEAYQRLFEEFFQRWDNNHDGRLDVKEINAVINNPQIHGNDSAIAVVLRRRLQPEDDDDNKSLTLAQALELAKDPRIQRIIQRRAWHIQAINHSLLLPGEAITPEEFRSKKLVMNVTTSTY